MPLNSIFQRSNSHWVKYSEYECKPDNNGVLYITPTKNAKISIYDPLKDAEAMILSALNVGMLCMNRKGEDKIKLALMEFVANYGLLSFMTALPTTPEFMDYEAVYLPKNHFIKTESLHTDDFMALFFPFDKLDVQKKGKESRWNVTDREMIALTMTMQDRPTAVNMSFQRNYAERYDWLITQFKDLAFSLCSAVYYYEDAGKVDEMQRELYQQAITSFGGIAPTYHIAFYDKPTIVWDFQSLLLAIQMMFSFMLTDEAQPLRLCRHCSMAFIANHPNAAFCSHECKNRYNVYKSRKK